MQENSIIVWTEHNQDLTYLRDCAGCAVKIIFEHADGYWALVNCTDQCRAQLTEDEVLWDYAPKGIYGAYLVTTRGHEAEAAKLYRCQYDTLAEALVANPKAIRIGIGPAGGFVAIASHEERESNGLSWRPVKLFPLPSSTDVNDKVALSVLEKKFLSSMPKPFQYQSFDNEHPPDCVIKNRTV
jgi:hypothetical protein